MAIAAIAGLTAVGGAMATAGTLAIGWSAAATAFAIGAGLSIVSRALMPKPEVGGIQRGITSTAREPTSSRKIVYGRTRVGGAIVYIHNTGNQNEYIHFVIVYAGHKIDAYEKFYLNDKLVWTADGGFEGDWGDYVRINYYDGTQTTSDANLTSESVLWTTDHKLLDNAYIHIRLKYDSDQFPQGVPNVSAVIRGKKVYDPRQDSTSSYYDASVGVDTQRVDDESTWEWSQNPAICLLDYLTDQKYGLKEAHSSIDYAYVVAAADACDEQVAYGDSTQTHAKFTCDGVVDTAETIKGNIEHILSSMGGRLVYSGGSYYVTPAVYQTPVDYVIDESVIIGQIQVSTKQSRRNLYNGVKGVFQSEEKNYILADYPAQLSSTYETLDGDPAYLDMALPFVTNNVRAQRIAKIALLKSRQQTQVSIPMNLAGLKFKAGDFIKVSNTRLGWDEKEFEVIDYSLAQSTNGEIVVNVNAIETDSTVYDWTLSDEQVFLEGGEVTLDDGRTVGTPVLSVTASRTVASDGTVYPTIDASWTEPTDSLVDYYVVTVTPTGYDPISVNTQSTSYKHIVTDTTVQHTVTVKAVNYVGVSSATATQAESPITDTTAPAVPANVTATGTLKQIVVKWDNPSDADFKHVEIYRAETNTAPTGGSTPLAKVDAEEFIDAGYSGIVTRYYWVRSVDTSGNKSNWVASGSATTTVIASADHDIPSLYRITTDDSAEPSNAEFNAAAGRDPKAGDLVITTDSTVTPNVMYAWEYSGSAWVSVPNLISGDLLVDGSITADKITVSSISSLSSDLGSITAGSLEIGTTPPTAGSAPTGSESGVAIASDGKATFGNAANYLQFDGTDVTIRGDLNADDITAGELNIERLSVKNFNNLIANNRFNTLDQWTTNSGTVTSTTDFTFGTMAQFAGNGELEQDYRLLPEIPANLSALCYVKTDSTGITYTFTPTVQVLAEQYQNRIYQGDKLLASFDLSGVTTGWQKSSVIKPPVFSSGIDEIKVKIKVSNVTSGNVFVSNAHVLNEMRGESLASGSISAGSLNVTRLSDISTDFGLMVEGQTVQIRFKPSNSAPASPLAGTVYFDNSTSKLRCWDGSAWNDLF